jgi:hypothetical protein
MLGRAARVARDDPPSARRFRINLSVIFRIDQGE